MCVKNKFLQGYEPCRSISRLDTPPSFFKKEARELIERGLSDIYRSVSVLKDAEDSQAPLFFDQQAVEKFLKAYLVQSGKKTITEVKAYCHRILDAFEECVKLDPGFKSIKVYADKLNLKDMSVM